MTETRCRDCGSHLGLVFDGEGRTPHNQRQCINSIGMTLEPADGA